MEIIVFQMPKKVEIGFSKSDEIASLIEEIKGELKEIIRYWKGKAREDKVVELSSLVLPEEVKVAWDDKSFDLNEIIHAGSKRDDGDGHLETGHEKPLKKGFISS